MVVIKRRKGELIRTQTEGNEREALHGSFVAAFSAKRVEVNYFEETIPFWVFGFERVDVRWKS